MVLLSSPLDLLSQSIRELSASASLLSRRQYEYRLALRTFYSVFNSEGR
jgi:hypothetical protein